MTTLEPQSLLGQLRWRYATKQFDPRRKISAEDWAALEGSLVLSPSSCGLQPWKFLVITDPALRAKLKGASRGQAQITDASHLVVFTVKTNFGEKEINTYIDRISEVRQVSTASLAGYRSMMTGLVLESMDESARHAWESCQIYIALGFLLTAAAVLGIDACPMEGIVHAEYDAILGLKAKNLTTIVTCTLGYRAATDKYAALAKVRFPAEEVVIHI